MLGGRKVKEANLRQKKNEKAELTLSEDVELKAPSVEQFEKDSESPLNLH